ncbi:hypothetical protein NSP_48930 [Nodularia spumigena CCY9414]|nr:hypothetical protein NSP_48930 [Nodularia spumigena CCY9414]
MSKSAVIAAFYIQSKILYKEEQNFRKYFREISLKPDFR